MTPFNRDASIAPGMRNIPVKHDANDIFVGGGEMAALMRSLDWDQTALGRVRDWPTSLKTTVGVVLNNRFPMMVWWGPKFTQLYNDSYRPVLGDKHPASMGQSGPVVWREIWHIIGPMAEGVYAGGPATWSEHLLLPMNRKGFTEETYFTFSYSAVPGDDGGVGGVLVTCQETTEQVQDERQLRMLRDLAARSADAKTADAACQSALKILAQNDADIPFALLYVASEDGVTAKLVGACGFNDDDHGRMPATVALDAASSWPLREATAQDCVIVDNLADRFGPLPCGRWDSAPARAVVMALAQPGQPQPYGFLVVGLSPLRVFDDRYRGLIRLTVDQIVTSIYNANAYEAGRKKAEALAELDRAKTTFFSNVSHELRTPLTLMLGPLEDILNVDARPAAEIRALADVAHRNALRLLNHVNSLLNFARIESGRMRASYVPTDLAAYTAELASIFRSAVEKAGMRLVVDCPPPRSPAFVDPEMWETIVLNLVSNAFKFTFDGEIRVQLREHNGRFELSVSDTGVGIAPSELPRLFERFHRVRGTRARTFEGTGIGLALVRELARLHGGDISVSSRAGEGSTFVVTVPTGSAHLPAEHIGDARRHDIGATALAFIHEAERWVPQEPTGVGEAQFEPGVAAHAPDTVVPAANTVRPRIVLADDNADMRGYLARLLSPHYEVEAVADGAAALERIKAHPPDLVLTDVMMPRLDGFGLLQALRANERVRSVPVIILSARAGEEASSEGLARGADDYLSKPFSARDLLARVRAQIAIRRRTAQFETLLNEAPLGVYLVDAEFRIRQVNPRARPVFGDIPDLIGRDFDEVIHRLWPKHYADEIVRIFRHTLETGEPYATPEHIEHRLDRNVTEYYEWRVDRMPLPEGGYGAVCYFRDISAQVKARASLQESEERFRAFVTASSDVVYAMSADWGEMRYLAGKDFIADTPHPDRNWIEKYIHPDDRARVLAAIERAIASKGTFELEHRVMRADGTLGWTFSRAIPLLDDNGEIIEWFGAARDVTERKHAEEALAQLTGKSEQERRLYQTILSSTPDLVYVFDRAHRFAYANDALLTMWGRTWNDAIGKNCLELGYEPWHAEMHDREIEQVVATKQPIRGQVPFTGTHGRRIYDYIFVPVIGTDGEVEAIAGTTRDVTEHKQSEDLLRDADRRKDEFIAMLAHELRNPLAPIANAVQLLRLAKQEDVLQAKARAIIERQTALLARFVDDLLDVSRITSGRLQLRREPVAIAGVVERAVESVRPLVEQQRHVLTVTGAVSPIYVDGDATRLEQVVVNLLNNAAKYTDPGGRIDLTLETENSQAVLRVKDTGIGIDAELRPRLFEPFVQAKRALDRSHGGLGIGLSLVKRLVEMHDGAIEVTSVVGQGSTFVVRLPMVSVGSVTVLAEPLDAAAPVGQPLRLLVVDDNVDAAQSLAILLADAGHSVHTAYDGREALDMARECRPHIAFVDIGLPELDGYEVARHLRSDPAFRHTQLIAMTGYGQTDDHRRSLAAGFDRHLVKPADFPKMLEIISEVAARLAS